MVLCVRTAILACFSMLLAICVGCSSNQEPAKSQIKSAVLHAGDGVSIGAGGKTEFHDAIRLPAGSQKVQVWFSRPQSGNRFIRTEWTFTPNLAAGQLYRFIVDRDELYVVLPLPGKAYHMQRTPLLAATQPNVKGLAFAVRDVPVDLTAKDYLRSNELAQALTPMVAEIKECKLSPEKAGLDVDASVLLENCPGALFLLEAAIVSGDGLPVTGTTSPMTVSREIGTGDPHDLDSYQVRIPWTMMDEALKGGTTPLVKVTLTDSLGRLRSANSPQRMPSRPAQ